MFAVIRIRGTTGVKRDISETLEMLNLTRINHAVLIEDDPSYNGMLVKAKDYITWGEIDIETLTKMIGKRARLVGDKRVTDEYISENSDYSSINDFAEAILNGDAKLSDLKIKKVFRLHPPRKGYKSIRRSFNEGGSLGFRSDDINNLLIRMI